MFEAGTRVTFPARQGDRDVVETGTVVPSWIGSRSRNWAVVELDNGYRLEVRTENLERAS